MKNKTTNCKKIHSTCVTNKKLAALIFKELLQVNNKILKKHNTMEKLAKHINRNFIEEEMF